MWWVCGPDGAYHIAREYKFKGMTAEQVGSQMRAITKELGIEKLRYVAADPAMWQKTGAGRGESIAETLLRLRLPMRKSDNDRFNGWLRVHELLKRQLLTISPSCAYLIRTVPAMVSDDSPGKEDDLDSSQDDHAVDALRYGAMSRPSPTRKDKDDSPPVGSWGWWSRHHSEAEQKSVIA